MRNFKSISCMEFSSACIYPFVRGCNWSLVPDLILNCIIFFVQWQLFTLLGEVCNVQSSVQCLQCAVWSRNWSPRRLLVSHRPCQPGSEILGLNFRPIFLTLSNHEGEKLTPSWLAIFTALQMLKTANVFFKQCSAHCNLTTQILHTENRGTS